MSDLSGIYDALEAMDVTLNAAVVPVFNYDELPDSIQTAQLPCRLLHPLGEQPLGSVTPFTLSGTSLQFGWTIFDLFLLRPVGQGIGLVDAAPDLVAYMGAYAAALKTHIKLVGHTVTITGGAFDPALYAYPRGGAAIYFGVMVTLRMTELA
ncbi:MAG: hypothetical protein IT320_20865 [Anaerolineae bacterium]|nr:hypothetical protein [Anaerolineae bacterium]